MARLDFHKTHRLAMAAVLSMEGYSRRSLPTDLYHLIKLRASLINRCYYCIDLHTAALRDTGAAEGRISGLADWESSEQFSASERAALALTDATTRLGAGGVPDDVWANAAAHFTDKQLGDLIMGIATINVWNRIGIAARLEEA
jgi:AhpD family alkylhydroperoxidase